MEGAFDSLGLASASLGREARLRLEGADYHQAIRLYRIAQEAGEPWAVESLAAVASRMLKENDATLEGFAREAESCRLITSYLSQGPLVRDTARWLNTLEKSGAEAVPLAEQFALIAYQSGDMEACRRWINRAEAGNPLVKWINSRLALQEGKVEEAASLLSSLIAQFPTIPSGHAFLNTRITYKNFHHIAGTNQIRGELGLLNLTRRHFVEALDHLYRGRFFIDAAYVAERVLTTDELKDYVDAHWPAAVQDASITSNEQPGRAGPSHPYRSDIRWWLARRLVRDNRVEEAGSYFPDPVAGTFKQFAIHLDQSRKGSTRNKAEALWKAAQVMKTYGLELAGTETGPDWAAHGGNFSEGPTDKNRTDKELNHLLLATPEEQERSLRHTAKPDKRWHYRYVAAQMGWKAASDLPDNTDQKAEILWMAGSWIKLTDPTEADRFYKALVRQCGNTDLGKRANELKWFPPLPGSR